MIFSIVSVGLAKIILKICAKQNFKYSNLLTFYIIGLILAIVLKVVKFDLSQGIFEFLVCIIINIIIFVIFKHIKKLLESKNI